MLFGKCVYMGPLFIYFLGGRGRPMRSLWTYIFSLLPLSGNIVKIPKHLVHITHMLTRLTFLHTHA